MCPSFYYLVDPHMNNWINPKLGFLFLDNFVSWIDPPMNNWIDPAFTDASLRCITLISYKKIKQACYMLCTQF